MVWLGGGGRIVSVWSAHFVLQPRTKGVEWPTGARALERGPNEGHKVSLAPAGDSAAKGEASFT